MPYDPAFEIDIPDPETDLDSHLGTLAGMFVGLWQAAVNDPQFRVLRPGGRIHIAGITVEKEIPEGAKRDIDLWTN